MSEYLFGARDHRAGDPSGVGLVQLALPLILEHILYSTVNLLDVLFISRISDHAVNSVSVPGQYLNICQMLAGIVATGTITAKEIADIHFFSRKQFKGQENVDALMIASPERSGIDCIVTRNPEHYRTSQIAIYNPNEFLKQIEQ